MSEYTQRAKLHIDSGSAVFTGENHGTKKHYFYSTAEI